MGGRFPRLGLFVVVRFPVVRGMAVLTALSGVSVRITMRAIGNDFIALVSVVLRFLFVSVPRSDQAVAARLTEFRGDLAEEFEVVRVASTVAGPARRADGRRMPVGPAANGPAGSVDLLVLFVRLFFVVDVGSRAEDRLHEVDAQRRTGSGARKELATGLLRDQAADVREDDYHEVSVRPHPEGRGQGLDKAPHVRDHEIFVRREERQDARSSVADHHRQGRDEVDLVRREVVRVRDVRDVDGGDRHERRDDRLDRRAGPATSDVAGDHGPGWLDPPQQERQDQDYAGRGPERKRWPIPMETSGLAVDLDPVDAGGVRPGPRLRLSPPAGRLVLLDVPGATGPEKPPE